MGNPNWLDDMTALQRRPELDLTAHGFAYDPYTGSAGGWTMGRGGRVVEVFADNGVIVVAVRREADGSVIFDATLTDVSGLPAVLKEAAHHVR